MIDATDLKPCPFCGGKAEAIVPASGSRPYVMCTRSYCTGPQETLEAAIALWNRRAVPDPAALQAERDALAAAHKTTEAALVEVARKARRKALEEAAAVAPGFPIQKAWENLTQCEQAYANGVVAYQNRIRALMTE